MPSKFGRPTRVGGKPTFGQMQKVGGSPSLGKLKLGLGKLHRKKPMTTVVFLRPLVVQPGQVRLDGLANAYLQMGERAHAEEIWSELRERATRTQDANLLIASLNTEATVATLDGRLEDALVVAETIRSKGAEFGIPGVGRDSRLSVSVHPLFWLGRIEEFLSLFVEGHPENWVSLHIRVTVKSLQPMPATLGLTS